VALGWPGSRSWGALIEYSWQWNTQFVSRPKTYWGVACSPHSVSRPPPTAKPLEKNLRPSQETVARAPAGRLRRSRNPTLRTLAGCSTDSATKFRAVAQGRCGVRPSRPRTSKQGDDSSRRWSAGHSIKFPIAEIDPFRACDDERHGRIEVPASVTVRAPSHTQKSTTGKCYVPSGEARQHDSLPLIAPNARIESTAIEFRGHKKKHPRSDHFPPRTVGGLGLDGRRPPSSRPSRPSLATGCPRECLTDGTFPRALPRKQNL